jgi:hypothetical protein
MSAYFRWIFCDDYFLSVSPKNLSIHFSNIFTAFSDFRKICLWFRNIVVFVAFVFMIFKIVDKYSQLLVRTSLKVGTFRALSNGLWILRVWKAWIVGSSCHVRLEASLKICPPDEGVKAVPLQVRCTEIDVISAQSSGCVSPEGST